MEGNDFSARGSGSGIPAAPRVRNFWCATYRHDSFPLLAAIAARGGCRRMTLRCLSPSDRASGAAKTWGEAASEAGRRCQLYPAGLKALERKSHSSLTLNTAPSGPY